MILMIDHDDSFTYNIVHYLEAMDEAVHVVRSKVVTIEYIERLSPEFIILSPGPGHPTEAIMAHKVIDTFGDCIPILGICLGFQVIVQYFKHEVKKLSPVHGHIGYVEHNGTGLYQGVEAPAQVARYHSLGTMDNIQKPLIATGMTDNIVMSVAHESWPLYGIQFHPESVLTTSGYTMLNNFLMLGREFYARSH
ncbi:anthranilate synthase component II [Macrococcus armenti]|uniref:Aminodeoxychorismate/anthranilate synthase component II n=1 Tax=Macrococcus armenti TaxID=2875764 RepID=A0ABY3ZYV6_9STAP|nr:aminodeoxychorismate/anthranilate synthase component II [Macrococcus armenti]UOB21011.1 aminodeoxychorismate/anthranilate synthase component II [Macrococcus armenti]